MKKHHITILIGALCAIVLGALYMYERRNVVTVKPKNSGTVITDNTAAWQEAEALPSDAADTAAEKIKVYIVGEVKNPGVYELDSGSRLDDVINLAGGETENADLLRVNKAAYVQDAQHIIIPAVGEAVDKSFENTQNDMAQQTSSLININTAEQDKLTELPGIGPATAANIIDYREKHGHFQSVDDIKKVTRIGDKTYDRIKELITVN